MFRFGSDPEWKHAAVEEVNASVSKQRAHHSRSWERLSKFQMNSVLWWCYRCYHRGTDLQTVKHSLLGQNTVRGRRICGRIVVGFVSKLKKQQNFELNRTNKNKRTTVTKQTENHPNSSEKLCNLNYWESLVLNTPASIALTQPWRWYSEVICYITIEKDLLLASE